MCLIFLRENLYNLAVVIVTHNSEKTIGLLLDRLLRQTATMKMVIVVDNASTDNTIDIVNRYQDLEDNVNLFSLSTNQGGAGGFRTGLEHVLNTEASYIVTMDDDALPTHNNFLETMLSFMKNNSLDVVSPVIVDADNSKKTAFYYKIGQTKTSDLGKIIKHTALIPDVKLFNGTVFRRSVISQLKGPEPKYFIRGDEEEFKQRILSTSFKVGICNTAFMTHPSSVNEYHIYRKKRFHHCVEGYKLYYSTRNRIHTLIYHSNLSKKQKTKRLFNEFKNYSSFYLIYRKMDIKHYKIWCRAYVSGFKSADKLLKDRY